MTALDEEEVVALLGRIGAEQVEAIAVSLLWSTLRPDHELRIGALIGQHLQACRTRCRMR
jgi:N-methylhydantoinase A